MQFESLSRARARARPNFTRGERYVRRNRNRKNDFLFVFGTGRSRNSRARLGCAIVDRSRRELGRTLREALAVLPNAPSLFNAPTSFTLFLVRRISTVPFRVFGRPSSGVCEFLAGFAVPEPAEPADRCRFFDIRRRKVEKSKRRGAVVESPRESTNERYLRVARRETFTRYCTRRRFPRTRPR